MPKKLVRDKVPFLMRSEGLDPKVTVETENRWSLLTAKLMEEAAELAAHPNWIDAHEEMADVREVFEALVREFPSSSNACTTCGMPRSETLERAALRKREAKGGLFDTQVLHTPERVGFTHDLPEYTEYDGNRVYVLTTSKSTRIKDAVTPLLEGILGDKWYESDDLIYVDTGHVNRLMVDKHFFDSLPADKQSWLVFRAEGYALALYDEA